MARHGRAAHPIDTRIWENVDTIDPSQCWRWTGKLHAADRGYAKVRVDGRLRKAHRVAYELLVGPIPAGLVLDHTCRVRHCLNPDHLEPVTNAENVRRGIAARAALAA